MKGPPSERSLATPLVSVFPIKPTVNGLVKRQRNFGCSIRSHMYRSLRAWKQTGTRHFVWVVTHRRRRRGEGAYAEIALRSFQKHSPIGQNTRMIHTAVFGENVGHDLSPIFLRSRSTSRRSSGVYANRDGSLLRVLGAHSPKTCPFASDASREPHCTAQKRHSRPGRQHNTTRWTARAGYAE